MIAIVDYGVGNVRSVERALLHVGANATLTADPDELDDADGMVLPGVGAFAPALEKLSERGLGRRVVELAQKGRPILGVCLGYQLLFDESSEHGLHQGLGLLPGRVREVDSSEHLPVIGWCRLTQTDESVLWKGIADGSYMYFVHSYTPESNRYAIASTEHSPSAAAARRNVMGTQFHPEKSGPDGLRIYESFVKFCG
ncbi:MAG: imidazole glycerol phosphate synthase subunit HisH [Chloroflexi bacterium]|nr:MAG: imidazole glycerol phosphate synthase subunit HisH [Chloroflexota bacterium]TMC70322.1 MAG: imidazole glycerol phosphate synthase subunit HisH [Chloroflexota bacterium]